MRIRKNRLIASSITLAAGLAFVSAPVSHVMAHCGSCHSEAKTVSASAQKDIVDTAVSAGSFQTLVAAVKAAGLVDALKGDGPFTVFAPSDDAFAKLPKGTLETLLEPKNSKMLASILKYHVVAGRVPAEKAINLDFANTLNGQRAGLAVENGTLSVGGAKVVTADIETSNGIIHVIDTVILPADKDIVQTAEAAGSFKTLAAAIGAAGLADVLGSEGPFTVFAPTDDAFAALPAGTVDELLKPENRRNLIEILKYHVVSGRVYADQALAAGQAMTLQEGKVTIAVRKGTARVNDAKILKTDVQASNGVIHVIDAVLMPSDQSSSNNGVRDIIRAAVHRGAPLYNDGQHSACAAVYEMTAMSLLEFADTEMHDRQVLRTALRQANSTHSPSRQAWILRDALDEVYASHGSMRAALR